MAANIEKLNQSTLFFSNKLEALFTLLKHNMFVDSGPFSHRILILPNRSVEEWIRLKLARDLNISSGFAAFFLNQALHHLLHTLHGNENIHLPTSLELALRIEKEIWSILTSTDLIWKPLLDYLEGKEKRLLVLAGHLGQLFLRYGIYGGRNLKAWDENPSNWQQLLWQKIFNGQDAWEYPHRLLERLSGIKKQPSDLTIHLFSFSYLPPLYFHYLQGLGNTFPVFFYQLSPCKEFWSDLKRSQEPAYASQNPLLISFGKIGRMQAKLIEESEIETVEAYVETKIKSQLACLQKQLLTLDVGPFAYQDNSIQLHSAPTPHREVQIVYNLIISMMEECSYAPSDFLVMAPNISVYAPYISAVFQTNLPVHIQDVPFFSNNIHLRGMRALLELDSKRWSAPHLLHLLSHPLLLEKQGWGRDTVCIIRRWIQYVGIRWGIDLEQRNDLLKKSHCLGKQSDAGGTWQQGFDRLLDELTMNAKSQVSLADAPLLGECIELIYRLRNELSFVHSTRKETIATWISTLKAVHDSFFAFSDEKEDFFQLLDRFERSNRKVQDINQSFHSFYTYFQAFLENETTTLWKNKVEAVRFGSLHVLPAKVIFIMGLNEGAFPRQDASDSFDLLQGSMPNKSDSDRYLFLEILISAQEKLIFTYVNSGEENPSILLQEMMPFISKQHVFNHPVRAYDPLYFCPGSGLKNYAESDFQMAKSLYQPKASHRFIPEFYQNCTVPRLPKNQEAVWIALSDLTNLIQSPLKLYFHKTLGLYVQNYDAIQPEEDFILSPLHFGRMKRSFLQSSVETILHQVKQEGWFPLGVFRELASKRVTQEAEHQHKALQVFGLKSQDLVAFHFLKHQKVPQQDVYGNWLFPPIKVQYGSSQLCNLIGTIEGITPKGFFVREKSDLSGALKSWPLFLILNTMTYQTSYPVHTILFGKNGVQKEFPGSAKALSELIDYYFIALQQPSPLFPTWIEAIITGDGSNLEKHMRHDLESILRRQSYGIQNWLFREGKIPSSTVIIKTWQKRALKLFEEVVHAWF